MLGLPQEGASRNTTVHLARSPDSANLVQVHLLPMGCQPGSLPSANKTADPLFQFEGNVQQRVGYLQGEEYFVTGFLDDRPVHGIKLKRYFASSCTGGTPI